MQIYYFFFKDATHQELKSTQLALTAELQRFVGLETEAQIVQVQVA